MEPPWLMTRIPLTSSIHSPMPYQASSPTRTCGTRRVSKFFSVTSVEPSGSRPRCELEAHIASVVPRARPRAAGRADGDDGVVEGHVDGHVPQRHVPGVR